MMEINIYIYEYSYAEQNPKFLEATTIERGRVPRIGNSREIIRARY